MATYHCAIKVGHSGKTMPHLQYIKREGRYKLKQDDLISVHSGNLPKWATNEDDYWQSVAAFDARSYREIEFALPNELPREEQESIVQEFIEEVIPNHPYTYAIHEVDSAVHGIKNPHVHLMFSERMNEEFTENMDKEQYFKRRGCDRSGNWYGGSRKDRDWAGRGRTKKYYQVRETIARKINEKYEKHNLPERVSHKSLEDQSWDTLKTGNVEQIPTSTKSVVRINEGIFIPYIHLLQKEIYASEQSKQDMPNEIKERIAHERERILQRITLTKIEQHNQALTPTEEHENFQFHQTMASLRAIQETVHTPFSYLQKTIDNVNTDAMPQGAVATRAYTRILTSEFEEHRNDEYVIRMQQLQGTLPLFIANLESTIPNLESKVHQIQNQSEEEILRAVIGDPYKGKLAQMDQDIQRHQQTNLLAIAKEIGVDVSKELQALEDANAAVSILKDGYLAQHKTAIHQEAIEMQQKAIKWKSYCTPKAINVYEDRIINERHQNVLKEFNNQIRSRDSLLFYIKRTNGNPTKVLQEKQQLEQTYRAKRAMYLTPDVRSEAKALQDDIIAKHQAAKIRPIAYYENHIINTMSNGKLREARWKVSQAGSALQKKLKDCQSIRQEQIEYIDMWRQEVFNRVRQEQRPAIESYQQQQQEQLEKSQANIRKAKQLLALAKQALPDDKKHTVDEAKSMTERVTKNRKVRSATANAKATQQTEHMQNEYARYYQEKKRPITWYEDNLINEATNGALKYHTEQLRSKENILTYIKKEGKPVYEIQKIENQVKYLQETIQDLRTTYLTPELKAKAKVMYDEIQSKPFPSRKQTNNRLRRILNKPHVSVSTKSKAKHLLEAIAKPYQTTNQQPSHMAVASYSAGEDYNMDRQARRIR